MAAPRTATTAASVAGGAASAALPASAGTLGGFAPRFTGDLSAEQLAQIEKQWCSHGHAAHRQAMAAVDRAYAIDPGASAPDEAQLQARFEARFRDPASHAAVAVRERLRTQWAKQLQQRNDVRSQAAAAYLGADTYPSERQRANMARLRSLAEGGQDPLVWLLWRKARRVCLDPGVCGPATLRPWHQIEPDNLMAWLPLLSSTDAAALDWSGIAATRHARSYREDFIGLLLPLLEQESPGLALQEGLALVDRLSDTWPTTGATLRLLESCNGKQGAPNPERKAVCAHAAELLWRTALPTNFDRLFALQMAAASGRVEQAPWTERLAFMNDMSPADADKLLTASFHVGWDQQPCEAQPRLRSQLKDLVQGGEWAEALGLERAARVP